MDISAFISELLYGHDCIIIPGFGGFICACKPAVVDARNNSISPPSKSISFNINLQVNDGLLVNYIANKNGITFQSAFDLVQTWNLSARSLLTTNRELTLKNIGTFHVNESENIEFTPAETINYLKASYGLPVVQAAPITRGRQIELPQQQPEISVLPQRKKSSFWRIAAALLLIGAVSGMVSLVWLKADLKSFRQNEAGMVGIMKHAFAKADAVKKVPAAPVPPAIVKDSVPATVSVAVAAPAKKEDPSLVIPQTTKAPAAVINSAQAGNYYVIVGVFAEEKNAEAAQRRVKQNFPDMAMLVEKTNRLTRIGFAAGTDYEKAKIELSKAQAENPSFWLLKK